MEYTETFSIFLVLKTTPSKTQRPAVNLLSEGVSGGTEAGKPALLFLTSERHRSLEPMLLALPGASSGWPLTQAGTVRLRCFLKAPEEWELFCAAARCSWPWALCHRAGTRLSRKETTWSVRLAHQVKTCCLRPGQVAYSPYHFPVECVFLFLHFEPS